MERGLSIATRLAAHPTSAISDALDELQIAGALSGITAQREGIGRVCGRALAACARAATSLAESVVPSANRYSETAPAKAFTTVTLPPDSRSEMTRCRSLPKASTPTA